MDGIWKLSDIEAFIKDQFLSAKACPDFLPALLDESIKTVKPFWEGTGQRKRTIQNKLLKRLLSGELTRDGFSELMIENGLYFGSQDFIVSILNIDDFGRFISYDRQGLYYEEIISITSRVLAGIIQKHINDSNYCYFVEINGKMVFIINILDFREDTCTQLSNTFNEIKNYIKQNFNMTISIGFSEKHTTLNGISTCYEEAQEALKYLGITANTNTVLKYSDIEDLVQLPTDITRFEKNQKVINHILTEDFESALKEIIEIIENDIRNGLSTQVMRLHKYGVVNDIYNAVYSMFGRTDLQNVMSPKMIDDLLETKNVNEFFSELSRFFKELRKCSEVYNNYNNKRIANIIAYIENNIDDPGLTVYNIAKEFDLSVSHITRIFRKNLGLSTLDYIQKKRIEKAEILLANTNLSIVEISKKTGFNNYRTLTSIFKKITGLTPSQFRKNKRKSIQKMPEKTFI